MHWHKSESYKIYLYEKKLHQNHPCYANGQGNVGNLGIKKETTKHQGIKE